MGENAREWVIFAISLIASGFIGFAIGVLSTRRYFERRFKCYYQDWVESQKQLWNKLGKGIDIT